MEENYNVFMKLNLVKKETFHSAMIAAIIEHDKFSRDKFLERLKDSLHNKKMNPNIDLDLFMINKEFEKFKRTLDTTNNNHKWIDTENVLKKLNKKDGDEDWGRADIWIGTNKAMNESEDRYRLIIENKIDAGFQYRQLRGYYRYLIEEPRKFAGLFVLCVNNNEAFREKADKAAVFFNTESQKGKPTQYAIITYENEIIPWLENVKEESTGDFKKVVSDYLELVESLVGEKKNQ